MNKRRNEQLSSAQKRIFIVEDHPVFREGLVQILNDASDLTVCGEAGNAREALKEIARLKPDLVLVDITLPGESGLVLIKKLRKEDKAVKVLVVSMHDEALYAARVLQAGGDGYIMKQEDPEEITQAVRDVLNGLIYVSEQVARRIQKTAPERQFKAEASPLERLTDVELEVLELIGYGKSNQEMARQLRLTASAVTAHRTRISRKLNLKTPHELIRYAARWVESGAR